MISPSKMKLSKEMLFSDFPIVLQLVSEWSVSVKDKAKSIPTFSYCLTSDGSFLNNVLSPQEQSHSESYGCWAMLYWTITHPSSQLLRAMFCLLQGQSVLKQPKSQRHIYVRKGKKKNPDEANQKIFSCIGLQLHKVSITHVCPPGRSIAEVLHNLFAQQRYAWHCGCPIQLWQGMTMPDCKTLCCALIWSHRYCEIPLSGGHRYLQVGGILTPAADSANLV